MSWLDLTAARKNAKTAEDAAAIARAQEVLDELREAAIDYASLIQVEKFNLSDIAVQRAYTRLRDAIGAR